MINVQPVFGPQPGNGKQCDHYAYDAERCLRCDAPRIWPKPDTQRIQVADRRRVRNELVRHKAHFDQGLVRIDPYEYALQLLADEELR